jgi:hypothetical protein
MTGKHHNKTLKSIMMVVVVIPPSNMSSRIPAKKIYNEYKV